MASMRRRLGLAGTLASLMLAGCATCSDPRAHILHSSRVDGDPPEMTLFRQQVSGALARELRYPVESCRAREKGSTTVELLLQVPGGTVADVKLIKSSGHARLDAEAVDVWRRLQAQGVAFVLTDEMKRYRSVRYQVPLGFFED
jgi:TonB family protein